MCVFASIHEHTGTRTDIAEGKSSDPKKADFC